MSSNKKGKEKVAKKVTLDPDKFDDYGDFIAAKKKLEGKKK